VHRGCKLCPSVSFIYTAPAPPEALGLSNICPCPYPCPRLDSRPHTSLQYPYTQLSVNILQDKKSPYVTSAIKSERRRKPSVLVYKSAAQTDQSRQDIRNGKRPRRTPRECRKSCLYWERRKMQSLDHEPEQDGILTPDLMLRLMSMRPHLSSQFWSPLLYWIFHGSSKAENLR
jgi:hypothetical protein